MSAGKILFVASVVKHHISQFHIEYLKWFRENGFEVHVCAKNDYLPETDCHIPCCDKYFDIDFSRLPFSIANIGAYFRLKKLIDDNDYTLIHCHTPVPAFLTRFAAIKARRKGTKLLYTTHGFHFYNGGPLSGKLFYLAEKIAAGYTDGIITVNAEDYRAAQAFSEKYGCKCHMINGIGVDTEKIKNYVCDRASIRAELGIPDNAFLVMTTAEINKNKNITGALKAISLAKRDNIYYLVCGEGKMLERCREYARDLGISDRVIFAGYRRDATQLLHIADVFLFPSFREGLGLAAIEAMSAGLPLIASDIRGVREYAVSGKNSILVDPHSPDDMAKAIGFYYDNPEIREAHGENAVRSVNKFDIKSSVAAMADIYGEYINIPVKEDQTASDNERVIM